ncbi:Pantothenate transporter [Lasiodiplodia theobromae]|uniref:Pantothenate transporter n=1 Tax=Lasiodiplodia theobromae TaxID=45133 RepID=UPI0015C39083|nr:Pantothenate transporter [Lasiodiplodia theobromae]KAF4534676.1 Pantothenate transporter [Lasiodiplodia theobromae]
MSIGENVAKSGTTVTIGETSYSVDLTKVPYLESYLRFQSNAGQSTVHSDIPLFAVAYDGLENGYRQYFRKLPDQLDQYHTLCETLDILCADVLQQQTVKGLFEDLREGKGSYECEYKRSVFVKGDKKKARDAAFKLLYLILRADFESDVKDSQLVYNAVLFVVSHRGIFKYRIRKMVRAAYEERFIISTKQMASLNQWPIWEPGKGGQASEDEATTESSSEFDDWDSDY